MNIHEYQAKQLLEQFNIPIPRGVVLKRESAQTEADFSVTLESVLSQFEVHEPIVLKSQIHAGGRGKGKFIENGSRGIQIVQNREEARNSIHKMIGNTLITAQTGPQGRRVHTLYCTEKADVVREFYVSILMDFEHNGPVLIVSEEGGTEIEELAQKTPEKLLKIRIHPFVGLANFQAREAATFLNIPHENLTDFIQLLKNLYRLFIETDALLVEINPLILDKQGRLMALDAKIQLDDNALFRHKNFVAFKDPNEKDPKEVEAEASQLNYIALDGDIACLVNGAGLAMATMDIIQYFGGHPANFLDVGGGANAEQICNAFRIILRDPNVKSIFINVFGGILRCDLLAEAIIEAAQSVCPTLPIVVRLRGNRVERAYELLQSSHLPLKVYDELESATKAVIKAAQGGKL